MSYPLWHKNTIKKVVVYSDIQLYIRTFIFSLFVYAEVYFYIYKLGTPGLLNKSVADTAIILIGLSMLLTSLCYFWNFVDTKIIYRKYLGVIGFFYGVLHVILSFSALLRLLKPESWQKGIPWPLFSGLLALGIFAIMALISNRYAAYVLGGIMWRRILRVGYLAVALIWVHVFLLKSARIVTWYMGGMKTPPSASLVVLIFMAVVVVLRILLWISLLRKQQGIKSK